MPRRPQKRTAERRRQRPQSPTAIDPLVGPGNPPHRHSPCAKTDQPRSRHCMVHLATRTSSHRSKSPCQAKYATVMLGRGDIFAQSLTLAVKLVDLALDDVADRDDADQPALFHDWNMAE